MEADMGFELTELTDQPDAPPYKVLLDGRVHLWTPMAELGGYKTIDTYTFITKDLTYGPISLVGVDLVLVRRMTGTRMSVFHERLYRTEKRMEIERLLQPHIPGFKFYLEGDDLRVCYGGGAEPRNK